MNTALMDEPYDVLKFVIKILALQASVVPYQSQKGNSGSIAEQMGNFSNGTIVQPHTIDGTTGVLQCTSSFLSQHKMKLT